MDSRGQPPAASTERIAQEAVAAVERWLDVAGVETPTAESRFARLLADEAGAKFATDFIDQVLRPTNLAVAGRNFERVAQEYPLKGNWLEATGTHLTGGFAPVLPAAIVPRAREHFLKSVGHLLIRGDFVEVNKQVAGLRKVGGIRPTVAMLAGVASGRRERRSHLADLHELLRLPEVESVSIRPGAFLGKPRLIDFLGEVEAAVEMLSPLYEFASHSEVGKLINLDVAVYEELEVTLRIFERMAKLYPQSPVCISLPACLPDSFPALLRIIDLAKQREADGGVPITVRFTRGEHFAAELAQASQHGWKPATFDTEAETDANYLRLLSHALAPKLHGALRVISATHNLFTLAYAWRLARARGVERYLEHEFMLGITTAWREIVKRDVGGIRLFTPAVQPDRLALAAPYLKTRLTELSRGTGALSMAAQHGVDGAFARERKRFIESVKQANQPPVASLRSQHPARVEVADFSLASTRDWASAIFERTRDSASGEGLLANSVIASETELDALIAATVSHADGWGERRGSTRATVLESVAEEIEQWRGLLVETMVSESSMTLPEADADVSAAISLARRAADGTRELELVKDANYQPPRLIVVVSPRAAPLIALATHVLSALGAGSAVIIKAAPETRRSSAVFVETLIAAGVPAGLVAILADEGKVAKALIRDPRVDHILHEGSRHIAKLFHSWRAETRISSITGGRNSVIVTQSANFEAAVAHIVSDAFHHAGQSPTSLGTVILVGKREETMGFRGRLSDAVASVPVTTSVSPGSGISALSRPADSAQRHSLETLADGETWLVKPQQVDSTGRWWTPGLRDNVAKDAAFVRAENRSPVLGVVCARTLAEAIEIQNSLGFGLVAAIHSQDQTEIEAWLDGVEAGFLSVNSSTGAVANSRGPVQGWNRSAVGTASLGGHDRVLSLGRWRPVAIEPGTSLGLTGISEPVARLIGAAQAGLDFVGFDWVRAGAISDEQSWLSDYQPKVIWQTPFTRIEHKHAPVAVTVRLSEGAPISQLVRVLAAAARTQSAIAVSTATPLHTNLIAMFHQYDSPVAVAEVLVESDARWHARVLNAEIATTRIRLIGGDRDILARVLHGQIGVAVFADQVTTSGRVELLPFLRGQTICTGLQHVDY